MRLWYADQHEYRPLLAPCREIILSLYYYVLLFLWDHFWWTIKYTEIRNFTGTVQNEIPSLKPCCKKPDGYVPSDFFMTAWLQKSSSCVKTESIFGDIWHWAILSSEIRQSTDRLPFNIVQVLQTHEYLFVILYPSYSSGTRLSILRIAVKYYQYT